MSDLTPQFYDAMDRAGLVPGSILTKRMSMEKIVNEIRVKLATELTDIFERREHGNRTDTSEFTSDADQGN